MIISNILKQNKVNKELQEKLNRNLVNTRELVRSLIPEDIVENEGNRVAEVLNKYDENNKDIVQEKIKNITLKYPEKTVKEAEIEYQIKVKQAEANFKAEYEEWNQQIYRAHQTEETRQGGTPRDPTDTTTAVRGNMRIAQTKPYYIQPTHTIVKVGDTQYELQMERKQNPETHQWEWEKTGMNILERAESNDTHMENTCIAHEDKDRSKIDWETTIQGIKYEGEKLGYGKRHFLICILRILRQNQEDLYQTYKEETDPEKIAQSLLTKYMSINKRKIYENKLKTLQRERGQSIRDVMCQADILSDRILHKCRDTQEKKFRKYQIMLDALKSFTSAENSNELVQALRGASLGGDRPDISELIDTVEIAEKINEKSRPDKTLTFMNEHILDTCEVNAVSTENISTYKRNKEAMEKIIHKAKDMNIGDTLIQSRRTDRSRERGGDPSIANPSEESRNRTRRYDEQQRKNNFGTRYRSQSRDNTFQRNNTFSRDNRDQHSDRNHSRGRNKDRDYSRGRDRNYSRERREPYTDRNYSRERREPYTDRQNRDFDRSRDYSRGRQNRDFYRNTDYSRGRQNRDFDRSRDYSRERHNRSFDKERDYSRERQNPEYVKERDYMRNRDNSRDNTEKHTGTIHREERYTNPSQKDRLQTREWNTGRWPSRERNDTWNRERGRHRSREFNQGTRSQSKGNDKNIIPSNKRNLEGIEFPPVAQMCLSSKFCVKCMNNLEEHYPWDCKLFRYWSNTPCDICFNGQHTQKECRKNPNRVDAFSAMMETRVNNVESPNGTYTPF